MRQPSTRDRILDELKTAVRDTFAREPWTISDCPCDDCRAARAKDVTPNPRILQIQAGEFQKMLDLAAARHLTDAQLIELSVKLFGRVPIMLREIEAAAVMAHLERGDV